MPEKHRILIVEDDEIMQRALAISLERAGFRVTCASTFKEALDLLETEPFSVVITDIFLPDGDGIKVLKLSHVKQPNTPVLGMTAYEDTELGHRAKELFGVHLFEKPFNQKILVRELRNLVEDVDG